MCVSVCMCLYVRVYTPVHICWCELCQMVDFQPQMNIQIEESVKFEWGGVTASFLLPLVSIPLTNR